MGSGNAEETPAVPPSNGECETDYRNGVNICVDSAGDNTPGVGSPRLPPGQKPDRGETSKDS
jgi:hypothetical protein